MPEESYARVAAAVQHNGPDSARCTDSMHLTSVNLAILHLDRRRTRLIAGRRGRTAMFRYQILGILRRYEGHGYALGKEYERLTGRRISAGNVYRELQRMVGEGLIRQLPKARDGDQRREPYQITETGRTAFDAWFSEIPRASAPGDSELAARALFFADVQPSVAKQVIEVWRSDP